MTKLFMKLAPVSINFYQKQINMFLRLKTIKTKMRIRMYCQQRNILLMPIIVIIFGVDFNKKVICH